ncbi:MAG: glycosyltransferase family 39 protein [Blastocatellia bacterium]
MARYKFGWEQIALIVILLIGLAARLHEVLYNFDGDEIFSARLASKSFPEVIAASLQDRPHPPLHNVLLHFWMKAFGATEGSARALSIAFSLAFLLAVYGLLRRLLPPWLALGVLGIFSLSPLFVYYGQQARPYSLIAFFSAANLLAFVRVLEAPRERGRPAIWAISCAFLLYTQYLAVLFIGFQISFIGFQISVAIFYLRSERLKIIAYGAAGCAAVAPWIIAAMVGTIGGDPLPHISWMGPPALMSLVWYYISLIGNSPKLPGYGLLILLIVPGIAYLRRTAAQRSLPANHLLLFLIGIGLPAVVYLASVWGPKPVFASRQLLGAGIAFVAAIGVCIATLPRSLAAAVLLALLAWSAFSLPEAFPHNTKPPWRDVATRIDTRHGSMIVVALEDWVSQPLNYYRRSGSVRLWSELAEAERAERFLFVCRPFKCSEVETATMKTRASLLATWRWGSSEEATDFNQLRLYEVRSAAQE